MAPDAFERIDQRWERCPADDVGDDGRSRSERRTRGAHGVCSVPIHDVYPKRSEWRVFSDDVIATTSAPRYLMIWTRNVPTPPDAPVTTTRSLRCTDASNAMFSAVAAEQGSVASLASSMTVSVTREAFRAGTAGGYRTELHKAAVAPGAEKLRGPDSAFVVVGVTVRVADDTLAES
jgi:hypothetical protein